MNLTTAQSPWLIVPCLLLGAGLAWWLYRRGAHAQVPGRTAMLLAVCRALVIAFTAFLLLEPMLRILVREVRKPVVVVAHDGSASLLAAGDTAYVRNGLPRELERLVTALSGRAEVRTFTYGDGLREGLSFVQDQGITDIGQALREVHDRFGGPDLAAVVLTGDGIHNRGRDPRLEAPRLGVPLFAIALGDTTVRPDLLLREVRHNRITYLGNDFPMVVRVQARQLHGRRSRITIRHEDREVAAQDITITGDPFAQEIPFVLKADKPGLQRYTVAVRTLDREASEVNNTREVFIEVLDARQRVLLLAPAPHPDIAALRLALAGAEGYEVVVPPANGLNEPVEGFDLVVLHGLPTAKQPMAPLLDRIAARGIPLLVVLGGGTDLGLFNALNTGVRVTNGRPATTDATATVERGFTAFTIEPEMAAALERFPPLQLPFGDYEAGRSASVLLRQRVGSVRTPYPLLALQRDQDRIRGALCGEGIWRWRLADMKQNGSHERFDRFVRKLVQFMALKADKKRFRVEAASGASESESLILTGELYNAAYEPVNGPEVTIVLKHEDGREYPYTFMRTGNAYRLDAGRLPAGRYTWTARTELDGQRFTANGELLISALMLERLNTVADHRVWADLAAMTGGLVVEAAGADRIARAIGELPGLVARSYAYASFDDLIGLRWLFVPLLLLLTVEWALRRRHGTH